MESEAGFNKLYVIECLEDHDVHTGTHLLEELEPDLRRLGFGLAGWKAQTVCDVLGAFAEILDEVESGDPQVYPMLQIDAHGDETCGVALPSGEFLSWYELASCCRDINAACANNLIVVANLCHGIGAIAEISISQLTPFFALIGPSGTVTGRDGDAMSLFYRRVLATGDIEEALAQLPHRLEYYVSERLFLNAFAGYLRDASMGRGRSQRVERLLSAWQRRPAAKRIPIGKARARIKKHVKPNEETFDRWKNRFLMADHPDNHGRFLGTYAHALGLAGAGRR